MIFDTHCHCYYDGLSERIDEVIENMQKNSVTHAVQIGCDLKSSQQAIDLAKKYPNIFYATAGFHPCEANNLDFDTALIEKLDKMISNNKNYIVGVGECGLDFHYLDGTNSGKIPFDINNATQKAKTQIENQKSWWQAQAKIAKKYNLPMIIHSRDARDETLKMIFENNMKHIIMHCYSEDVEMAKKLLDFSNEIYFSFSGIVTYKKSEILREVVKIIPLERILVETDAPYLSPQSMRGKPNEPAFVKETLDMIISLRKENPEIVKKTIFQNSQNIYKL